MLPQNSMLYMTAKGFKEPNETQKVGRECHGFSYCNSCLTRYNINLEEV